MGLMGMATAFPRWPGRWFWGVELHQHRHSRAERALLRSFNPSALVKRAVPGPSGAAPEGLAGMAGLAPLFPGGAGGGEPLLLHASFFVFPTTRLRRACPVHQEAPRPAPSHLRVRERGPAPDPPTPGPQPPSPTSLPPHTTHYPHHPHPIKPPSQGTKAQFPA